MFQWFTIFMLCTLMYTTMIYLDLWKGTDYYNKITCTWLPGDKKSNSAFHEYNKGNVSGYEYYTCTP